MHTDTDLVCFRCSSCQQLIDEKLQRDAIGLYAASQTCSRTQTFSVSAVSPFQQLSILCSLHF